MIREIIEVHEELKEISQKLQKYNELRCDRELTADELKKVDDLVIKAEELARSLPIPCSIIYRTDPRVRPIILLTPDGEIRI